jgi:hypothetical protein
VHRLATADAQHLRDARRSAGLGGRINVGREKADRVGIPQRPLKPKTQKRIAGGLDKWVLKAHQSRSSSTSRTTAGIRRRIDRDCEPLDTVTAGPRAASTQRWTSNSLPTPARSITAARRASDRGRSRSAGHRHRRTRCARRGECRAVPVHGPAPRRAGRAGAALALDRAAASDRHRDRQRRSARRGRAQQALRRRRRPVSRLSDRHGHQRRSSLTAAAQVSTITARRGSGYAAASAGRADPNARHAESAAAVAAHLVKFRGDSVGNSLAEPMPTVTSGAGARAMPARHTRWAWRAATCRTCTRRTRAAGRAIRAGR